MFPREHLPLTLVTVALLGMLFIMFRELNALKSAVAHLSVPAPVLPIDENEQQQDTEDADKEEPVALNSPKKNKSSS